MKSKIVQIVLLVVVFSIIGGVVYNWVYQNTTISIEREKRVACTDPLHQGNRVSRRIEIIRLPRKEAKKYKTVQEEEEICEVCIQARREREEREARERAEKEEMMRNLKVSFGYGSFFSTEVSREIKRCPGEEIGFSFQVENHGSKPIEDIKVLIEPGKYLRLKRPEEYDRPKGARWYEKEYQIASSVLTKLTSGGIVAFKKILPEDSPYYNAPPFYSWTIGGTLMVPSLLLKENLTPGQDIYFTGYVVIKGHKMPVGTLTVHVMYPK